VTCRDRLAANLSMLFAEHPLKERFHAAAEAGFTAVEIQFPYSIPAAELAGLLDCYGLRLVLHNFPAGDWPAGERGLAILPDRIAEFRASVDQALDYARQTGCSRLNCLSGITPAALDERPLYDTFIANLGYAADRLADHGVTLLIEPINNIDMPGFFLNRMSQALDVLDRVNHDNLRILFDVYHMHIMGEDILSTLDAYGQTIGHVQIADHPGRHEPGSGGIPFADIFARLDAIGYDGWIGCEYHPQDTTLAGLTWCTAY